ncbi:hypothetical protein D0T87_16235 [Bacteroides sp. 51]|nr:hypothetical protein [Bacteroides sp. 51]
MSIFFAPSAEGFLYDLTELLYEKEYFGSYESADKYVTDLVHDIVLSLPKCPKRKAPPYFNRYGKNLYYSVFKKNNNTQWYVFFNYEEDIYYIRYIGNNHTCAQYL